MVDPGALSSKSLDEPELKDIVALFHCTFHPTKGNIIDWSANALPDLDLNGVEFSCLPSGLHLMEEDVIHFTRQGHQGVCIFRRRKTSEEGMRGARLGALGLLVDKSPRPRPWRHLKNIKRLSNQLDDGHDDRECLRRYFEECQVVLTPNSTPWEGWASELSKNPYHPVLRLPQLLRLLGPSTMTFIKHLLGRKRVMIWTHPAAELSCLLAIVGVEICFGQDDFIPTNAPTVLGMVGLSDMERLKEETARGNGWIACTTDRLFMEKPSIYDLIIDFSTPSDLATRPFFYVSRPRVSLASRNNHVLRAVRFSFSDLHISSELDRILIAQPSDESKVVPDLYESCCLTLAWLGLRGPLFLGKGGIRIEGDDELSSRVSVIHSTEPAPELEMNESRSLGDSNSDEPTHRAAVDVALALLSVIYRHVNFLNGRLSDLIDEKSPLVDRQLVLYPRDVSSFDLSPLSELDSDFLRDFAWAKMQDEGVDVILRRSWRDILSMWFSWP